MRPSAPRRSPAFRSAAPSNDDAAEAHGPAARAFFEAAPLTKDLTAEELAVVVTAAEYADCSSGTTILNEGDPTAALYFLASGTVDVLKQDADGTHRFAIATLETGDFFGEMSFVDDAPASATVRADGDVQIWRLTKERLHDAGPTGRTVYYHLVSNVTHTISERLRTTNTSLTTSLREKLEAEQLRNQFGHFFIMIVMIFGVLSVGTALLSAQMSPVGEVVASWAYILAFFGPVVYYVTRARQMSLRDLGLTLERWPQQLAEGATCAAVCALLLMAGKSQLATGEALFSFRTMQGYSPWLFWGFFALYLPHSFLQEFMARGLLQGPLHRFMADDPDWMPILVASFLFGIGHVHYSYAFAGVTFATSLIFGWLYVRHRSVVGVTVAHYLGGLSAMALGLI
jgi:CRP-like cAMP-binding protein